MSKYFQELDLLERSNSVEWRLISEQAHMENRRSRTSMVLKSTVLTTFALSNDAIMYILVVSFL